MTHQRRSPVAAALIVLALIVLALPGVALGHAELDTVSPADKATVAGPPTEIVMTFTQHLDASKSSIKLVNASNTVLAENSTVDADRITMRLPVPAALAPGTYTARWTSFSTDDNEQDRGTTTFTVAAATPPPSVAPTARPSESPTPSAVPASVEPSVVPSVVPTPSGPPTSPAASSTDALIPVVVVVIAIVALGLWLLRGRARRPA